MLLAMIIGFVLTAIGFVFLTIYIRSELGYLIQKYDRIEATIHNLPDQMAHTIKSVQAVAREHDSLEGSINDVAREMETRIATAHRDWSARMEGVIKEFNDRLAVNMDGKSYTDMKIAKLAADLFEELRQTGEKNLRDTHRAVWEDLDGTLTTMRTDMDSSLNQRTVKVQDQIKEIAGNIVRNIDKIESSLEALESRLGAIEHEDSVGFAPELQQLSSRIDRLERDLHFRSRNPAPEPDPKEGTTSTSSLVEQLVRVGMERIKDPDMLSNLLKKVLDKK